MPSIRRRSSENRASPWPRSPPAVLITEDLPAAPERLDRVFVSPAQVFGSFTPGEQLGTTAAT